MQRWHAAAVISGPGLVLAPDLRRGLAGADGVEVGVARQIQAAARQQQVHVALERTRIGAIDRDQLAITQMAVAARIGMRCHGRQGIARPDGVAATGGIGSGGAIARRRSIARGSSGWCRHCRAACRGGGRCVGGGTGRCTGHCGLRWGTAFDACTLCATAGARCGDCHLGGGVCAEYRRVEQYGVFTHHMPARPVHRDQQRGKRLVGGVG